MSHLTGIVQNICSVCSLQELLTAQMVPNKKKLWEAGGHREAPIRFDQISYVAMRRMSGNSFNQAVATSFVAYVLCHMHPDRFSTGSWDGNQF